MSVRLVEAASSFLSARTGRRGFLARSSLVATALAVAPAEYVLRPQTAYAAVCRCGGAGCSCGSACCDGYTEFCCTLHGSNTCPPGTFAGGWWRADGSAFCNGPRYYIDCHGECTCADACHGGAFCPECDGLSCGCGLGSCDHRWAGCTSFRYGQCHTEISCVGRIACRVVTCTPAYLIDNECGTNAFTDEATANHNAPCLEAPPVRLRAYGYATDPQGGWWLAGPDGGVFTFDGAPFLGSEGGTRLAARVTAMAATRTGQGYWLVGTDGGVFTFGDAGFHGSTGGMHLFAPVVGMAPTPTGNGYWLVAADGGVFTFGDAGYHGSMGGHTLVAQIAGLYPTATGLGYYLLGENGAVYSFGDASFHGAYQPDGGLPANGIDSFYGMTLWQSAGQVTGYVLHAVSSLRSPPSVRDYTYGSPPPAPTPGPTTPTTPTVPPPPA